jgi:hypothetical protein
MTAGVLALALFLALPAAAGGPPKTALPPPECLRLLRQARIAGMEGDPARELEGLRQAAEAFPAEIAPVAALLDYHRRNPLTLEEVRRLRELLLRQLEDPALPLSPGILAQMASDPEADEATLRPLADRLARRVEEAAPDLRLLGVLAELQRRLGGDEAAVATLERQRRLGAWEVTVDPLLNLYRKLERWGDLADLLGSLVAGGSTGLRPAYVHALSRAGRFEEALGQTELLLAEVAPAAAPVGAD